MTSLKSFALFTLITLTPIIGFAQTKTAIKKPKLVVGIVVDQMRYDYLTRFDAKYGKDGFKRLKNEGFDFRNQNFNYIPTYTGPGHASIYTGTTPQNHGIIGNDWYNKYEGKMVYCAQDDSVSSVGTSGSAGKMSPRNMKTTTIGDQNRLATQMRGKTIGMSMKDRGAILPAGHTANAAYWFEGHKEGNFITSTYYMNKLPRWVSDFNASAKAKNYLQSWNTLMPIETYTESGSDLNNFETGFKGKETATFPYDLNTLKKNNGGYDMLKTVPFGNSLLADFALAAIDAEQLGMDDDTDFLTVSFSSTDYVGHNFGVNSKEIEDTYIRLDLDIARILKGLDEKVGKGNYTLFLTADHAAVDVPSYLQSVGIPAGYFDGGAYQDALKKYVAEKYGRDDLIENISNFQVFFTYAAIADGKMDAEALQKDIANFTLQYDQVDKVYTRAQMEGGNFTQGIASLVQKGFSQKRSGDVFIILDPAVISYGRTGSTHGSAFIYDTHVPLLFYGAGIKQGNSYANTYVDDIAPTIAALLGIQFPNGNTGKVLSEVLE